MAGEIAALRGQGIQQTGEGMKRRITAQNGAIGSFQGILRRFFFAGQLSEIIGRPAYSHRSFVLFCPRAVDTEVPEYYNKDIVWY